MTILKTLKAYLVSVVSRLFKKKLSSSESEHWVNHIYDETKSWPNKGLMWANVHGFQEGSEGNWIYWVGIDIRSFGFRAADYVIRCKNKSTYDEYVNACVEDVLSKMRNDSRLDTRRGDDVNIEFIFKWGDDDKSFNVHLGTDDYAEEK